jgi:hypothetical protein
VRNAGQAESTVRIKGEATMPDYPTDPSKLLQQGGGPLVCHGCAHSCGGVPYPNRPSGEHRGDEEQKRALAQLIDSLGGVALWDATPAQSVMYALALLLERGHV